MKTLKYWWIVANLSIIFLGGALLNYWYFIDGVWNPVLIEKADIMALDVDKKIYSPGDTITVTNAFCKLRPIVGISAVQIVDGQVLQMRANEVNLPLGCYGVDKPFSSEAAVLPRNIGKGTWHLEWTITYEINPIKNVVYKRRSVDFKVI